MPKQALALDTNDMKEAIADWAEKTTGKRPRAEQIRHTQWGGGQWYFETASCEPSAPNPKPRPRAGEHHTTTGRRPNRRDRDEP